MSLSTIRLIWCWWNDNTSTNIKEQKLTFLLSLICYSLWWEETCLTDILPNGWAGGYRKVSSRNNGCNGSNQKPIKHIWCWPQLTPTCSLVLAVISSDCYNIVKTQSSVFKGCWWQFCFQNKQLEATNQDTKLKRGLLRISWSWAWAVR